MKSALSSQLSALRSARAGTARVGTVRVATGAPARPRRDSRPRLSSRAKLGSCRWPQQLWIRHATCCFVVLFLLAAVSSADVLKVTVNDAIQPVTAEYIGRALDLA